jgi:hypothetical protein
VLFWTSVHRLVQGWQTILKARAQIIDNFQGDSFKCAWELAAKWSLGVFCH